VGFGIGSMQSGAFCALDTFRVWEARGDDARAFLNGQLSSDVKSLLKGQWQLSSYSTPKGRALASFVLAASDDHFLLVTRASVADAVFRRLGMFVMRSKVQWQSDARSVFGITGTAALDTLAKLCGQPLPEAGGIWEGQDIDVLRLDAESAWLLVRPEAQAAWQERLAALLPQRPGAQWDAVEVAAGRPWVEAATSESFVPQMLNLDLQHGGISFKKGCYPGQEIVARTQYLGKVKRRMQRFGCAEANLAAPGTAVCLADGQACGEVVLAAALETVSAASAAAQVESGSAGGCDVLRQQLLAVVQLELAAGRTLHLGAGDGPLLQPLELPYAAD